VQIKNRLHIHIEQPQKDSPMATNILRINASARSTESTSRAGVDKIITHLGSVPVTRDLVEQPPVLLTPEIVSSYFTPPTDRTAAQRAVIVPSDEVVAELQAADTLVIATPLYNFNVPAALKGWADMVARVGVTFKYTDTGAVGLLENKKAIVVAASGGIPIGSEMDFASPWLRVFLGFIGISDVTILDVGDVDAWISRTQA